MLNLAQSGEILLTGYLMKMLDDLPFSKDVLLALDTFAMDNSIVDRQEALVTLILDSLIRRGYLPHEPQDGTRPEDLTTDNDD